ncbi:MAG: hypothetical protein ACFFBD_06275 [Candidatus Hodarchaeota archaeon]
MRFWNRVGSVCIVIFILLVILTPQYNFIATNSAQSTYFYQILYVSQSDLEFAQSLEQYSDLPFHYFNLTEFSAGDQSQLSSDREGVILIANKNFTSVSPYYLEMYLNSMITEKKLVILLTPFINNILASTREGWGLNSSYDFFPPLNSSATFTFTLTTIGGLLFPEYQGQTFIFQGQVAVPNPPPSALVYANIINYTGYQDPPPYLPIPLIFSPNKANHTLFVMPVNFEFLRSYIAIFVEALFSQISTTSSGTTESSETTGVTEPTQSFDILKIFQQILQLLENVWYRRLIFSATLLAFLAALLILLRRFIKRFFESFWNFGLGFLVLVGTVALRPIYRRLDEGEVVDNTTRSQIIWFLEARKEKGAYFSELRSRLKLGTGQLVWHLEILKEFGIVRTLAVQRHVIYYLDGFPVNLRLKELEIALKSPVARKIILNLVEHKMLSASALARMLKRHRKTITNHLEKFSLLGVVDSQKYDQKRLFFITELGLVKSSLESFENVKRDSVGDEVSYL